MKDIKNVSKLIIEAIDLNLIGSSNPLTFHYYENDNLWNDLLSFVNDEDMMRTMIFNNDKLGISPVHTYCATLNCNDKLRDFEKNSIGRFWKFVFETLGYNNTRRVYRVKSAITNGKLFTQ
ncbi:hypothetical protein KHQ82_04355 [Mycoplasmatota bacterium]|nr:hypothetical protein KHQ82_04355 [Mycoplasmatota bacterium]